MKRTFVCIALLIFSACASVPTPPENPCLKRHGAIDIGSGSTKAFAAIVDVCSQPKHIVEVLFDQKVKIAFAENIERNSEAAISNEVLVDASAKIATLAEKIVALKVDSLTTVATAAFRKATNGIEVANIIGRAIRERVRQTAKINSEKLNVQILSQSEEAAIGSASALSARPTTVASPSDLPLVVWDIGGGSMQMLAVDSKALFTGDLASETFKNKVIQEIQNKPATILSPNPLGKFAKQAVSMARLHAQKNVADFFKKTKAHWIGIGGVLAISVKKQVEREGFSMRQPGLVTSASIEATLGRRASRTDEEIDSEYRTTEITNLALVLGYMKELKIDQYEAVEASLVQGLIVGPQSF